MSGAPFREPHLAALAPRLAALEPRTRAAIAGLGPGLLVRSLAESNPRRLPTTPAMSPLRVRDGVVDAFLGTLARLESLAREADGADLRTGLWSPLAPVRLNLGDAFSVLVTHAERHLAQAERARRALGA